MAQHPELVQKYLGSEAVPPSNGKFAALNMEYPVNPAVPADDVVKAWGEFKGDDHNVSQAGAMQAQAIKLMDRAEYK